MSDALVPYNGDSFIAPAADVATALRRYQAVKDFITSVLHSGVDYGPIPGSDKPALKKPGAEKLASFFGLVPIFEDMATVEDWTGEAHGGEPFFYYRQKCKLYRNERIVASADGSCNSWEKKYRYRSQERVCPTCGKATIFKSNKKAEWYCWAKKGGCGATYPINDRRITEQETGQVKNPDVAEQVNTILKMAQKRALVAAALIATNASDYFTQDVDDFITADYVEVTSSGEPPLPEPPAAPEPADNAPYSLAEAENVVNSEGVRYGDIDSAKLAYMARSLGKIDARNAEQEKKLTCIGIILKARAANGNGH